MQNELQIINEVREMISLKQEGEYWDFKKEWPANKSDLLHDIICMANNLAGKTAYIIIGVDEEADYAISDVANDPNKKTTQNMVDFLRDKHFAGGIRPRVYIQSMDIDGQSLDIIVVFNEAHTPFYLTQSYQGVNANNIYTRVMDTNTPKTQSADLVHVEYLWRKRFGLISTPLERVQLLLNEPENWISSPDDCSMIEFYKYAPEYTIEHVEADRNGYEFYLFGQTDSRPRWYDINIRYHQTLIGSIGGVGLDGARLFTASPQSGAICFNYSFNPQTDIAYVFFVKGSLDYSVYQYYLLRRKDSGEAQHANLRYMECVLVFESEVEKNDFELYVQAHRTEFDVDRSGQLLPHFPDIDGYRMEYFKKEYSDSIILQKMLRDFRKTM